MRKFVGCLARHSEVLVGKDPVANIEQQQFKCTKAKLYYIFFDWESSVDHVYVGYFFCEIGKISSNKDGEYCQDKFVSGT